MITKACDSLPLPTNIFMLWKVLSKFRFFIWVVCTVLSTLEILASTKYLWIQEEFCPFVDANMSGHLYKAGK